ncbi:MAG TPA: ribokinase [Candidatus Alistipes intestinipullorum]|nr:ribokinase [Candidatus Alistipes intestinipullorum]
MEPQKIVVIGSSNTDMVIKSEKLPAPGETVLGGTFLMNPGGKGANQAVAIARLGGKVSFICKTGKDLFAQRATEGYRQEGINTDFILQDTESPSGIALITVNAEGENCIVVAPGANNTLTPADIELSRKEIESADLLIMQLEIPLETVIAAARIAHDHGAKVILNPAPAPRKPLPDELLAITDILIPNRGEAGILAGIEVSDWESAEKAARILHERGTKNILITLGSLGSLCFDGTEFSRIGAFKVQPVDTTAAGDTFCGALCVALSEGQSLAQAARFASYVASISVTRLGAQSSVPYRREIDERQVALQQ